MKVIKEGVREALEALFSDAEIKANSWYKSKLTPEEKQKVAEVLLMPNNGLELRLINAAQENLVAGANRKVALDIIASRIGKKRDEATAFILEVLDPVTGSGNGGRAAILDRVLRRSPALEGLVA